MVLALSKTFGENIYVVSSTLTVPMIKRLFGRVNLRCSPPYKGIGSLLSIADKKSAKYLST